LPATVTRRFLPVLLLTSATFFGAVPSLPEITASRTEITDAGTVFTGNARLDYDGAVLIADQISYDPKAQTARAIGAVSLTRGSQRLLADELLYNLETSTYFVKDLRFGQDPLFVSGSSLEGSPDKIIVHDAVVTYSEPDRFAPRLRAGTVTYIPDNSVRAESARIGVGPVTPIPVPIYDQSVSNPLISYISAKAGYSSDLGAELELGLLAPFNRSVKLGGNLGIYTERGVMFGPATDYEFNNGDNVVRGSLTSGYISDDGDRNTDLLGDRIPKNRGYVSWEHYQTSGENLTLLGQLNYWSDSDIIRDFREEDFRDVQTPDNFLEGYHTGDNYIVSAFTRYQPNDYHAVQRRLPEISFDGLPVDAGAGIYHRVNASIAALEDKSLPSLADNVNRVDAYYGLTRPFTPHEWFSFKPVAGARVTHYDGATGGKSDYTRVLGEIGFDAELQASSTYNYKNERWKIDGLRHLVKPYVSYRAIPGSDRGTRYIPPIDRTPFSTYLQPLGLGDRRDIDTLGKMNTLRLGVDNALQTRDPVYGSRNLAELNVATDWRMDRTAGQDRLSALQSELALNPARWLRFDVYSNITPEDMTLREINTGVTFQDPGIWSVRVGTDYLKDSAAASGIQHYTADLRYFLNEAYEALARFTYDSKRSGFSRQSFGIRQNIRNLWFIEYVLTFREGDSRASDTSFGVSIELASF
jgi:LPS-assembly protein